MSFFRYIVSLAVTTPIIILLIYISVRLSRTSFDKIGIYRYVTILERTNISKDSAVLLLKVGDEGILGISSNGNFETLKNLNSNEIKEIELNKNKPINLNCKNIDFKKIKALFLEKINIRSKKNGDR